MPEIPFEGRWRFKSVPNYIFQRKMCLQKRVLCFWITKASILHDLTGVLAKSEPEAAMECINKVQRSMEMNDIRIYN